MKRGFSFLMCVILLFGIMPMTVAAETSAKYINVTAWNGEEPSEFEFNSVSSGDATSAMFVNGTDADTYVVQEDVSNIPLFINNVAVTVGEGGSVGDYRIAGSGSLNLGDVIVSVGSYTEPLSGNSVDQVVGFFTSEAFEWTENSPGASYNYNVTGNYTINNWIPVYSLSVDEGKTLTQQAVIDATNVTVQSNGTIHIASSGDPEFPNGLNIEPGGSLTVNNGGNITAADGQILEIRSGATVSGITLYDCDGETTYSNFENTEIFSYNAELNRWVRQGMDPGPGEEQIPDNKYMVRFDPRGNAGVTLIGSNGSEDTELGEGLNSFAANTPLSFRLTKPDDVAGEENPIVYIRKNGEEINISDTLTYNPSDDTGFEIIVYWTQAEHDFDRFGPGEGQIMLEYGCQGDGYVAVVDPELQQMTYFNWTKVVVADNTPKIELKVVPNQDKEFIDIVRDFDEEYRLSREDLITAGLFNAETSVYTLTPDGREDGYYRLEFFFTGAEDQGGNNDFSYQEGFERLQEEVLDKTYFAFGDVYGETNGSATADADDLRYGVMRTLYDCLRVQEGQYQREGAVLGLKADFQKEDPTNLNLNMEKLMALATVDPTPIAGETIRATDKSGTPHTYNAYKVTITIDKIYEGREQKENLNDFPDENEVPTSLENPIVLTAKVYLIDTANSSEQVFIKVKDTYYIRDAYSEPGGNEDDLENFDGLNARALIIVENFDSVDDIALFGNFASSREVFSDETSDSYYAAGFGTNGEMKYLGDKFVVYKPDFLGVTITGTGETKQPMAWGVESSLSIAETGRDENKNTETDIYFGFSSLEIAPITSTDVRGLGVEEIQSVEVLDGIPENAVRIVKSNDKYTVEFLSDYYDTVRIRVNYGLDDDSTASGIMTLNRVGIMIQGGMTAGDSHTIRIMHGHNDGQELGEAEYNSYKSANTDKQHGDYKFAYYATYYYPTSSQATAADVSLFVTYTYEDGSVERKLLETDYFTAATNENVAMSDYILYMGNGNNAPVKVEAIAVKNANDDGTISGAKLGAGKGVENIFDFND